MSTLEEAVDALQRGDLVVIPTDTVYGIAASLRSPAAIERIFAVKGRPAEKALPVLGADRVQLFSVAEFGFKAERLTQRWWPGPLTIVLPRAEGFEADLGGPDRTTVAVRVPGSDLARSLLESVGPLAVTSANRSGEPPAVTVAEARAVLGDAVAVYLDEGPGGGEPSTVLSLVDEPTILREGAIPADRLLSML